VVVEIRPRVTRRHDGHNRAHGQGEVAEVYWCAGGIEGVEARLPTQLTAAGKLQNSSLARHGSKRGGDGRLDDLKSGVSVVVNWAMVTPPCRLDDVGPTAMVAEEREEKRERDLARLVPVLGSTR
jgi:hypothetical protein